MPRFLPCVPDLAVGDIGAAAVAHARRMGFPVDWTYEDVLAGNTTPGNLRPFIAQDVDGNRFRVFHDLGGRAGERADGGGAAPPGSR